VFDIENVLDCTRFLKPLLITDVRKDYAVVCLVKLLCSPDFVVCT
jgi:hypothetical protein